MARKLAAVAFSLGCLHAGSVMALGLGELELKSFLNEPLRASVDLLNMDGLHEDEIRVRLATTEDFEKMGLERAYFLTNISFDVIPNGQGGARIQIRSEDPVLEPYLDFIVEARWPSGRLLREYTVLVDPPIYSQSTPVVSASQRVAETDGTPAPAKKNETFNYTYDENRVKSRSAGAAAPVAARRDSGTLAPGSRYRISPDQTLWQIASAVKPSGVSVHQTMLDIQRLNPDAFINGNINRIKAGYVIYLPTAEDISSADLPTALAEVREQNKAWREGRDDVTAASSGPSLRISAEPDDVVETSARDVTSPGVPAASSSAANTAQLSSSSSAAASGESGDTLDRLAALEQQLATLQRIVSLKDDQIAALQGALKDAGAELSDVASPELTPEELVSEEATALIDATVEAEVEEAMAEDDAAVVAAGTDSEQVAQAAPAKAAEPKAAAAPAKDKSSAPSPAAAPENWRDYLLYGLGALILAAGAFVFMRRRNETEDEPVPVAAVPVPPPVAPQEDVFADVQLHDQNLELETAVEEPLEQGPGISRDNRGYGEHKHDEYASDVDAADALAEADIYIAYGRHPQAIELLKNALAAEPGNPVYRLKMLEIYAEQNNRVSAAAQVEKIEELGDQESIDRAHFLMNTLVADDEPQVSTASDAPKVNRGPGLTPNPLEIFSESDEPLEDDFSGLEIEQLTDVDDESDLDLSGDFAMPSADVADDEDLVIAADSNALSTKLDLARAYLDMGDDDGARQILDEVVAEGSAELKAEALDLLDRIG